MRSWPPSLTTGHNGHVTRVWVDGWQMQCCGRPFSVGATVSWNVMPPLDREFLAQMVGAAEAEQVTHLEERHLDPEDGRLRTVSGRVVEVRAVSCRYAPNAAGPAKLLVPVRGSAVIELRDTADGWEREADGLRFVGYLVDLDDAS